MRPRAEGSAHRPAQSGKNYRWANLSRLVDNQLPDLLADASIVVVPMLRPKARRSRRSTTAHTSSLRTAESELLHRLGDVDAMVVTVLAAGGLTPATAAAGGHDDSWNVEHLAALDIPILQGLCLASPRNE